MLLMVNIVILQLIIHFPTLRPFLLACDNCLLGLSRTKDTSEFPSSMVQFSSKNPQDRLTLIQLGSWLRERHYCRHTHLGST